MKKRHDPRNALVTLILWLCLGSLVILPIVNGISPSTPGFLEIDLEDYDTFDETDTDDDFLVSPFERAAILGSWHLKLRTINLDFQSALLSPDSPPPKQA